MLRFDEFRVAIIFGFGWGNAGPAGWIQAGNSLQFDALYKHRNHMTIFLWYQYGKWVFGILCAIDFFLKINKFVRFRAWWLFRNHKHSSIHQFHFSSMLWNMSSWSSLLILLEKLINARQCFLFGFWNYPGFFTEESKSERNPMLARRRSRQMSIYVATRVNVTFQWFFTILESFLSDFPENIRKFPGKSPEPKIIIRKFPDKNYPGKHWCKGLHQGQKRSSRVAEWSQS